MAAFPPASQLHSGYYSPSNRVFTNLAITYDIYGSWLSFHTLQDIVAWEHPELAGFAEIGEGLALVAEPQVCYTSVE